MKRDNAKWIISSAGWRRFKADRKECKKLDPHGRKTLPVTFYGGYAIGNLSFDLINSAYATMYIFSPNGGGYEFIAADGTPCSMRIDGPVMPLSDFDSVEEFKSAFESSVEEYLAAHPKYVKSANAPLHTFKKKAIAM